MKRRLATLVLVAAALSPGCHHGSARPAPAEEPASAGPAEPSALDGLAWMAGSWFGESDGMLMEEHWLEPKGSLMLGLHRDVLPSGKAFFEYLRIEPAEGGVVYMASPSGKPPTPFRLAEHKPDRVVFENSEHDWPQRIIYWREGDVLHARAEGDTDEGVRASEWAYRRGAASRE